MSTFVKDAMTTQVIWVEQDTPFAAIAAALREYRVSAFPVLDEAGQVIGVVSESDLLAKLALGGGEDQTAIAGILHQHQMEKARAVTAADLMTSPAATASTTRSQAHVASTSWLASRSTETPSAKPPGPQLSAAVGRPDAPVRSLVISAREDIEIARQVRATLQS